ncbi:MAG: DUF2344 domain-containing protein [Lachnospiraceae bacterium]|nr:DUF2344 domain-containing protein [Lachnospiraceae bacterium]
MKIRIKFTKEASVKYLGHLDIMRFFQRCFNRAGVKMVYSEGFNPHQKMSFAMPLGLGIESRGEYLDCEIADGQNLEEVKNKMNLVSGDGFHILSVRELKENACKVMAAVRFASYQILFDAAIKECAIEHSIKELHSRGSYLVHKKTKKKEQDVDILPQIINLSYQGQTLLITLRAGGDQNIKAETVASVLFDLMGIDYHREKITIMRLELFAEDLVPLEDFETIRT